EAVVNETPDGVDQDVLSLIQLLECADGDNTNGLVRLGARPHGRCNERIRGQLDARKRSDICSRRRRVTGLKRLFGDVGNSAGAGHLPAHTPEEVTSKERAERMPYCSRSKHFPRIAN